MQLSDVRLTDPDVFVEGRHHEMFELLRREDPVHWHDEARGAGFWCLTRHDDVVAANRDIELFSCAAQGVNILDIDDDGRSGAEMIREMMIMMDPPRHTRYRLLVNRGFTPRMVGLIETHLHTKARRIVDAVCDRDRGDFVTEVAAELPLQAICELLGIPEDDRHLILDISNRMVGADDPEFGDQVTAAGAAAELYVYAAGLRELRRRHPDDGIVSQLLGAEVEGHRLTDDEFDMFFLLLCVAGNETTRNATAHGMRALIEHPDQFELLKSRPELMPGAVEEILRWSSPIHHFRRTATRDVEMRDRTIRAGDKVVMWYASANRDEDVFADPFRFDITRDPNDHVAFGAGGPHFCLGANLARTELRLIFGELVTRLPDIEIAGEPEILRSNFIHGLKHLPVRFN